MRLNFGTVSRTVRHKPITLRNAEELRQWADKMNARAKQANEASMGQMFVELTRDYPQLLNIIDVSGAWNTKAIESRLESRKKQHDRACEETGENTPFDETEYRQRIIEEMQKELQGIIRETPMIAKILYFTTGAYPTDLASLELGIECVKAVAVAEDLQGIADDAWLDVSAEEVAEWVTKFCAKVAR